MKLDQRKDYQHFTAFDRFQIDGIHRPMHPRKRSFPWHQLGISVFWTLAGTAFVVAMFKAGGGF